MAHCQDDGISDPLFSLIRTPSAADDGLSISGLVESWAINVSTLYVSGMLFVQGSVSFAEWSTFFFGFSQMHARKAVEIHIC